MKRLAIISTHPVQYYAPVFELLAQEITVKVFYTWGQSKYEIFDPGFNQKIEWDIPLLSNYEYKFVNNVSKRPGSKHHKGIDNPTLIGDINDWSADAILVFGWNFKSHLSVIRYFKGKTPVFFRGDSTLLDEKRGFKKLLRRTYLSWVYKSIDFAFYVGKNNKAYFKAHGLKEEQLIFTPHAIDNKRFQKDGEKYKVDALTWRTSLGIKENEIVFLFVGKLEPVKNPELLLKAFIALKSSNSHLIFVGNGILEFSLREKAKTYPSHIHFIPFQNQSKMPQVYNLGDVFILPSRSETWGLAVNEAMACEKCVLISDKVGCAIDLVQAGKNGFIFKSQDEGDLVEKLKELTQMGKMQITEMGKASSQIIKEWSFDRVVKGIVSGVSSS